jgi:hypothetical protein
MSLINDALKKAGQTPAPTTPASTKEPLHVATHTPPPRWPMFVVPPLVAIVFAAGTYLVVRGWDGGQRVSAREAALANMRAIDAAKEQWEKESAAAAAAKTANPNGTATTTLATNSIVPETFPTLKLQGLIWHPQRPSVVLNGKSLFVGEKVEQAVVKAITPDSVTVVWRGEQRVLTLR